MCRRLHLPSAHKDQGDRMVRHFVTLAIAAQIMGAQSYHVYIGGYAKGIYLADFDGKSGTLSAPSLAAETPSPSFLAIHSGGRFLYTVNEVKDGTVSGFSID